MRLLVLMLVLVIATQSLLAGDAGTGESFKGPIGLQLYSLRAQVLDKGLGATLDEVKKLGFKFVELAGDYNMPPEKLLKMLEDRGLKAVSAHFPYERYKKEPEAVAKQAKALGLQYSGCAWIDHKGDFDEKTCREAAEVFNKAGEAMAKEGIKFFYHVHGFEFQPFKDGTLVDLLFAETKKENVAFQMDVLWIIFPGQDPAKLLAKYPGRWELMHLKDLKKGVATGALTGSTDKANNVVLGTGQVNWPEVLGAGAKNGVKWYFIEDESPSVEAQLAPTLKYLESVKF